MQIASRQPMWYEGGRGTVIEVNMTPATGLYIRFVYCSVENKPFAISWGDGNKTERPYATGDLEVDHTYAACGKYKIVAEGCTCIVFRVLDGQPQYPYDAAITSFVDRCGQITGSRSAAYQQAVNLERFIAPNAQWIGQRDFANCSKLTEAVLGNVGIHYDGSFQYCTSLEKFTTINTGCCWSYVWQGCTRLRELRLGNVTQFATEDFDQCPNLIDIWIDNKTVEQIKGVAAEGNIEHGYGAEFPWCANPNCRFHGTNGIVLGNGTIIHE